MPDKGFKNGDMLRTDMLQTLSTTAALVLFIISFGLIGMDWYLVAGLSVFVVILVIISKYFASRSKYGRLDERTVGMSRAAARNSYLVALPAMGVIAVIVCSGYITARPQEALFMLEALFALYMLMVMVQTLSYAYFVDRGSA